MAPNTPIDVCLQFGRSRVFACAIEWPGWCRRAKTPDDALAALATYAPRYAPVVERAGLRLPALRGDPFRVVHRRDAPTGEEFSAVDFGALEPPCEHDMSPREHDDAALNASLNAAPNAAPSKRLAAIVEAAWLVFDDVVAGAPPELRKGPRGGGRDRDKIAAHVLGAETSYARKIGVNHKQPSFDDRVAVEALRADIAAVLRAGRFPASDMNVGRQSSRQSKSEPWPLRYAARRIAWHVLDHAWEIEDRGE
jgi:hypothetical protein